MLKVVAIVLVVGALAVGASFLVLAFLIAQALEPPKPDRWLVPEVIGVVVSWDYVDGECALRRITVEGGETLELRVMGSGRVRCGDGPWETGVPQLSSSMFYLGTDAPGNRRVSRGLLYYGHDEQTEWIAGARSNADAAPSYATACPYILSGSGYVEGTVLHFSSGLVVEKAPGFQGENPRVNKPWIFRDPDTICVNREGKAMSLRHWGSY